MTALLDRRSTRAEAPGIDTTSMPQVDLTPPEVWASRALRQLQRRLVLGLGAVVLVVALACVAASLQAASAQSALAEAETETSRLLAEQKQYADVPVVLDRLDSLEQARLTGMSTEVLWTPYIGAIFAVMPPGVQLSSITTSGATPVLAPAAPADPLQEPSVGTVAFTGRSLTVPDTGAWLDGLSSIPGFQDAWVSGVETKEDDEDGVYYEVTSRVQFTVDAYAGRFSETEGN